MKLKNIEPNVVRFSIKGDEREQSYAFGMVIFIIKEWKKQIMHLRKADGSYIDLEYTSAQQFMGPGYLDQMATGDCKFDKGDIIEYIDVYL